MQETTYEKTEDGKLKEITSPVIELIFDLKSLNDTLQFLIETKNRIIQKTDRDVINNIHDLAIVEEKILLNQSRINECENLGIEEIIDEPVEPVENITETFLQE